MKLTGVYAPIATPFSDDGGINYDALSSNCDRFSQTKLSGLVVLGSNGESVLLSDDEKVKLTEFVCKQFVNKPVIAGTGCESTPATIELTKRCADVGAHAALVVTPSYYKSAMTDDALIRFYSDIADASPIPVILYNMPRNTGVNMSSTVAIKMSHHPNVIGIKDSGANIVQIASTIAGAADDFFMFAGSGSFLFASLCLGATGGTLAVANILPDTCADIITAYQQGDIDKARDLQFKILPANAAVTTRWGIGGLKAALDMIGYYGGPPRPPLQPISSAHHRELRDILTRAGAIR